MKKAWKDKLKGGLADDNKPSDFPKESVKEGQRVESEHTSDPHLQAEIALDHLKEDKGYYRKLRQLHKKDIETPSAEASKQRNLSEIQKTEELEKRSKNVREKTRNITPEQAEQRKVRYAQSIGLKPQNTSSNARFPIPNKNTLPYGQNFSVEHETAHAMMTPKGKTIRQYTKDLADNSKPKNYETGDDNTVEYIDAVRDENIANQIENKIDRRSGVSPKFSSKFRNRVQWPDGDDDNYDFFDSDNLKEENLKSNNEGQHLLDAFAEDAQQYVDKFDEGSKFDRYGRIQQPTGIDAKINARAKLRSLIKCDLSKNQAKVDKSKTWVHLGHRIEEIQHPKTPHGLKAFKVTTPEGQQDTHFAHSLDRLAEDISYNEKKKAKFNKGENMKKNDIPAGVTLRHKGWKLNRDNKRGMLHINHSSHGTITIKPNPNSKRAEEYPYVAVHNGAGVGRYKSERHASLGVLNYIKQLGRTPTTRLLNQPSSASNPSIEPIKKSSLRSLIQKDPEVIEPHEYAIDSRYSLLRHYNKGSDIVRRQSSKLSPFDRDFLGVEEQLNDVASTDYLKKEETKVNSKLLWAEAELIKRKRILETFSANKERLLAKAIREDAEEKLKHKALVAQNRKLKIKTPKLKESKKAEKLHRMHKILANKVEHLSAALERAKDPSKIKTPKGGDYDPIGSNSKLSKEGIRKFGHLAEITCPKAGACGIVGKAPCFADSGLYTGVAPRNSQINSLALSLRDDFVDSMNKRYKKVKAKYHRVHDSGDFYNQEYVDDWKKIAAANPDKIFYAYSKSHHLDFETNNPGNLRIIQSAGGKLDHEIDYNKPHAVIFPSKEALEACGYWNGSNSDLIAATGKVHVGLVYNPVSGETYNPSFLPKHLQSHILSTLGPAGLVAKAQPKDEKTYNENDLQSLASPFPPPPPPPPPKKNIEAPQSVMAKTEQSKKYVTVSQHWSSSHSIGHEHKPNPVKKLTHLKDLDTLHQYHGAAQHQFHDQPVKHWGKETYEVSQDGSLKHLHSDYDTSD